MYKNSRGKILVAFAVIVLLIFSAYGSLLPNVNASFPSTQQKGATILGDVVGLDLSKYNVLVESPSNGSVSTYCGIVPQENVVYNLTSDAGSLKALLTFTNGSLQVLFLHRRS
jgi:hypothetical protein